MRVSKFVRIFTDGSARGNPNGPGGYGCILQYYDTNNVLYELEKSAGYKKTTNNRMELMGVIVGIELLKRPYNIEIVSDSRYVVDAFNKHWIDSWIKNDWRNSSGQVKNIDLWKRLLEVKSKHESVRFTWIRGHNGYPENERCDTLATTAADGVNLLDDTMIM